MEILHQLGGLVVGSVPTMLLFILLVALYGFLVQSPLTKTLAERRSRTSGAVNQARKAVEAAEAGTAAYEEKLRAVRAELAAARLQRLHQLHSEREQLLNGARAEAQTLVRSARAEIDASVAAARKQIEDATGELSDTILRTLLPIASGLVEAGK